MSTLIKHRTLNYLVYLNSDNKVVFAKCVVFGRFVSCKLAQAEYDNSQKELIRALCFVLISTLIGTFVVLNMSKLIILILGAFSYLVLNQSIRLLSKL